MNREFEIMLNKTTLYETLFFKIITKPLVTEHDIKTHSDLFVKWKVFMEKKYPEMLEFDGYDVFEKLIQINKDKTRYFPEFSEITSISFGVVKIDNNETETHLKLVSGTSEKEIIKNFFEVMELFRSKKLDGYLCGHSIFKFEIPFLVKRGLRYGLKIPKSITKTLIAKPWESNVVDILDVWRFTGNSYIDIITIADTLNIDHQLIDYEDTDHLSKIEVDQINKSVLDIIIKIYCKIRDM